MSLAVALPCAVLSAVAYGTSTAVQQRAAHEGAGGHADARGLLRLLRDPRWLASVGGDAAGLLLQVVALATGPVVLVQPLLVLAVPVSLPVGWLLGGPRPGWRDYAACAAILAALAAFFAVVGDPGAAVPASAQVAALVVALTIVVGAVVVACVRGRSGPVRAAVLGAVAGAGFGVVGVLLDAVATRWGAGSWSALGQPAGWVPLVGLLVLGALALALTQVSFQIGALGASFPANESAAPVVAVLLGALVLHERVPAGPAAVAAYAGCAVVVLAGTVWLARAMSATPQSATKSAPPARSTT